VTEKRIADLEAELRSLRAVVDGTAIDVLRKAIWRERRVCGELSRAKDELIPFVMKVLRASRRVTDIALAAFFHAARGQQGPSLYELAYRAMEDDAVFWEHWHKKCENATESPELDNNSDELTSLGEIAENSRNAYLAARKEAENVNVG